MASQSQHPELPPNVHVSSHPCLQVKLSQLRDKTADAKAVRALIHEMALIVATEGLAREVTVAPGPEAKTPMDSTYTTAVLKPASVSLVPVLRSGLGMVEALQTLLPAETMVHHLGLYRERETLTAVEYYNNLPSSEPADLAIIVDPIIATGGTTVAAIQTLRDWGARRIVMFAILGATDGLARAALEWPEGVEIYLAGVDSELTDSGMLKIGAGDIGDRLFGVIGK